MSGQEPISLGELATMPLERLRGVGERKLAALHQLDLHSVLDLLTHYPRRYVDRTREARIAELGIGEEALVLARVRSVNARRARNGRVLVTAEVSDGSGRMRCTFFNQPWREAQLQRLGADAEVALFGRIEVFRGHRQMTNPVVDPIGDRTGRIVPIYPQSEKVRLTTWDIAGWVAQALRRCEDRGIEDPVPGAVLSEHGFEPRQRALWHIHAPESMADVVQARRRLAFDELLRIQVALVRRKREIERSSKGIAHDTRGLEPAPGVTDAQMAGALVERFLSGLPYALTGAQQRALTEIGSDLARPVPMHRLLQGDVGAGKTVVAVAALLAAVQGGHQGALMAPTEVLAEQHAATLESMLTGLVLEDGSSLLGEKPVEVALLTSRTPAARRRRVLAGLADNSVPIVVGTHALIQDSVEIASLGVVVIDEQHRFGVEQRAALRSANLDGTVPDVLVMTATPIPRTAAMTVYGDLDVTVLDELPPGRTPIETTWAHSEDAEEQAWELIRREAAEGRRAYVVCPLIEDSPKLEATSAEATYERLASGPLAGLRLGLLHGRMKAEDKAEVMERFRRGSLDVLVATTVIEVGVDVPEATVVVILDADRFGIAQLHQLRGRVGRGRQASHCVLVAHGVLTPDAEARLEALVRTTDVIELAEVDLDLRGEGTVLGERQKGRNDLKLASLRRDRELVEIARSVAEEMVGDGGGLAVHAAMAAEVDALVADQDDYLLKS